MQFSSQLPSIIVGVSLTIMWQVEVPAMMPSWLATPSPLKLMHSLKVEKILELFVKIQNICKMCFWTWIAYLMASMPRAPAWASMREAATGMAWLPVLFKFILMASDWSRAPTLWPGFLTWFAIRNLKKFSFQSPDPVKWNLGLVKCYLIWHSYLLEVNIFQTYLLEIGLTPSCVRDTIISPFTDQWTQWPVLREAFSSLPR